MHDPNAGLYHNTTTRRFLRDLLSPPHAIRRVDPEEAATSSGGRPTTTHKHRAFALSCLVSEATYDPHTTSFDILSRPEPGQSPSSSSALVQPEAAQ